MRSPNTLVIGGGLIGTAIAAAVARRGARVQQVADDRDNAASPVAAGMLAPVTEAEPTEGLLLPLNLAALARWSDFADRLATDTGLPVGLRRTPTLSVGFDADDAARLADLAGFLARVGLTAELRTGRQARRHVPLLAPQVRAGLWVESDWSVDNRLLLAALQADAERLGVTRHRATVTELIMDGGTVTGARLADGGTVTADVTVLATGAWSGQFPLPFELPIRPVKGQVVRLRAGSLPTPDCTVRAFTRGFEVYLVPRASGEVVIGATSEDRGFDGDATAGGIHGLLRDARTVLPIIDEYAWGEVSVGHRPASPDHAPIVGEAGIPGLVLAAGHHRNGVLLTPITAEVISELIMTGTLPQVAAPFTLDRFAGVGDAHPTTQESP
ncbi:glycine oxidase ThiO [Microlunatus sp. Y2014]|uniref:glycine oxidase ThiO n=1 Tax=Microlunatus sp. Y2014 TaxID=3418488 RepID=UPI003DA70192